MKSIGIVRQVDELGRIVIPKELRRTFQIANGDSLEIFVNGNEIVLKKYDPTCVFCGSTENISDVHDKNVCEACIKEIKDI